MLTLGEAAKEVGKSKTTLTRAINAGRLSAKRLDDGSYQIDPSELFRVYDLATPETVAQPSNGEVRDPAETPDNSKVVEMLREQIELIQTERERERRQLTDRIDELNQEREDWKTQASNQTLLLKHEQDVRIEEQGGRGWFARIFG